jgi:hypothetical protein
MALWSTQPLTEMSTKNIFLVVGGGGGKGGPVRRGDNLTTFMCRLFWNMGASTSRNPQDLSRTVMGLLYLYLLLKRSGLFWSSIFWGGFCLFRFKILPVFFYFLLDITGILFLPRTFRKLLPVYWKKNSLRPLEALRLLTACGNKSISSGNWMLHYKRFYFNLWCFRVNLLRVYRGSGILSQYIFFLYIQLFLAILFLFCSFSVFSCTCTVFVLCLCAVKNARWQIPTESSPLSSCTKIAFRKFTSSHRAHWVYWWWWSVS